MAIYGSHEEYSEYEDAFLFYHFSFFFFHMGELHSVLGKKWHNLQARYTKKKKNLREDLHTRKDKIVRAAYTPIGLHLLLHTSQHSLLLGSQQLHHWGTKWAWCDIKANLNRQECEKGRNMSELLTTCKTTELCITHFFWSRFDGGSKAAKYSHLINKIKDTSVRRTCETSVDLLLSPWDALPCTNLLLNEPLQRNKWPANYSVIQYFFP